MFKLVILIVRFSERHKKKTWTTYFVYVSCGIAKHLTTIYE